MDRTLPIPEIGAVLRDEFSIDEQYRHPGGTLVLVSVRQTEIVLGVYPNLTGRPEFVFECGHSNTGTGSKPASYHENCSTCGRFYCHACNYSSHDCKGCGEWLTHRSEHAHYKLEHADD